MSNTSTMVFEHKKLRFNTPVSLLILFSGFLASAYLCQAAASFSQVVILWFPAGFALVGCLLWGARFIPAIILGSFIFNYSYHWGGSEQHSSAVILSSLSIALASSLQAAIAAYLVKTYVGDPLRQQQVGLLKFLAFAGFGTCVIAPLVGVITLALNEPNIDLGFMLSRFRTWWLGDSFGAIVISLLLLSLLLKDTDKHNESAQQALVKSRGGLFPITLTCMLAFLLLVNIAVKHEQSKKLDLQLDRELTIFKQALSEQISINDTVLDAVENYIQTHDQLSTRHFRILSEKVLENSASLKALSWNPVIQQTQIDNFIEYMQTTVGVSQYTVRGKPLNETDPYIVVSLIEPIETNGSAQGFNVYSNIKRKEAMLRAIEQKQSIASDFIHLVQDNDKQKTGFLTFHPVFSLASNSTSETLLGFAVGIFNGSTLINAAFSRSGLDTRATSKELKFTIFRDDANEPFWVNSLEESFKANSYDSKGITLRMAGSDWHIRIQPSENYIVRMTGQALFFIQLSMVSLGILLSIFIIHFINRNEIELKLKVSIEESKTKSLFLANMSHEIRTPMNAIIGFLDLALEDKINNTLRDHLETASRSARSLLVIINDILDISKLESGNITLEKIPFNLFVTINDTIKTLAVKLDNKSVALQLDYDENLKHSFIGDPSRLRQVLINIAGNAIKFTEKGLITIAITKGDEDDQLLFSVQDTGIGMSQEQCNRVFDSFQQADAATTRKYGGTGLGTTISKQIIELMGGEIWAESEVGIGTTFFFTAPMPEAAEEVIVEEDKPLNTTLHSERCFNILLAEDIPENARLATFRLEQQNHHIVWTKNGLETVHAFKKHPSDFDLVLMDVQMPEMDGLDATRLIRQYERENSLEETPVIALTASILEDDRAVCIESGMSQVVGKPIDFEELFSVMENSVATDRGHLNTKTESPLEHQPTTHTLDLSCVAGVANVEKGIEIWSSPHDYAHTLVDFKNNRGDSGDKLSSLLEAEDYSQIHALGHALKGLAGNLSLEKLADSAGEIESAGKNADKESIAHALPKFIEQLDLVVEAINKLDIQTDKVEVALEEFDPIRFEALVTALNSALESFNPDEPTAIINEMASFIDQKRLTSIQQHVENFNFDQATDEFKTLLQQLKTEGIRS